MTSGERTRPTGAHAQATWPARRTTAIVFVICLAALLLRVPDPLSFAVDADQGQQLAGARQLLHGEHPFIAFRSTYGPLTYYASALAQVLSGGRPLGEVLLALVGYAAAYTLLFATMRRLTTRPMVAGLWLVVALATVPRFYKYYVVLGPAATLWAGLRYRERPRSLRLWMLAACVAATALYRLDFGLYVGLAAAFLIAWPESGTKRWSRVALFAGGIVACASPWLLWAAAQGGLLAYVADSLGSFAHARGMSLPAPRPTWAAPWAAGNLAFAAFAGSCVLPATAIVLAVRRRRACPGRAADVVATAILGQGTLIQASHRSDVPHLLQAIPLLFVLCAWLTDVVIDAMRADERAARLGATAGATALAVFAAVLVATARAWPQWTPSETIVRLRDYARPRAAFVDLLTQTHPDEPALRAVRSLRACTGTDQRILALPLLTSFYYLADRSFGGGKMYLAPGFFNAPADEARMIDTLRRQDVAAVVDQPDLALDGDDQRRMPVFAPRVSRFLDDTYVETTRFGPLRLRVRRDLVPPSGAIPCSAPP